MLLTQDNLRAALRSESVAAPAASNDIRNVIWKLRHRGEAWGMVPDDDLALALERALAAAPPALDAARLAEIRETLTEWIKEARPKSASAAYLDVLGLLLAATPASGEPVAQSVVPQINRLDDGEIVVKVPAGTCPVCDQMHIVSIHNQRTESHGANT